MLSGSLGLSSPILDNPNLPLNVERTKLPTCRDMWKKDKQCGGCGSSFRITLKKNVCKFCFRGTCAKCSGNRCLHPELGKLKRCCNQCYVRFVGSNIREELEGRIEASKEKITLIEDHLFNIRRNKEENGTKKHELEAEIRRRRLRLAQFDGCFEKEIADKKRMLTSLKATKSALHYRQKTVSDALTAIHEEIAVKYSEKSERESALCETKAGNANLKCQLACLQDTHREALYFPVSDSDISDTLRELERENESQTERNADLSVKLASLQEELDSLATSLPSEATIPVTDDSRLISANGHISERQPCNAGIVTERTASVSAVPSCSEDPPASRQFCCLLF